jgi:hypothetical protein
MWPHDVEDGRLRNRADDIQFARHLVPALGVFIPLVRDALQRPRPAHFRIIERAVSKPDDKRFHGGKHYNIGARFCGRMLAGGFMEAYQERVVAEKQDLDEKLERLEQFFTNPICQTLPSEEQNRLARQARVMHEYSEILGERIAAF